MTAATPRPPPKNESAVTSAEVHGADFQSGVDIQHIDQEQAPQDVPYAVNDAIASWRRIMTASWGDGAKANLDRAAVELWRLVNLNKVESPKTDGAVRQAVFDSLQEMAEAADISDDEAQKTFARAKDAPLDALVASVFEAKAPNGYAAGLPNDDDPPPSEPDDYFTAADAAKERPASLPTRLMQSSAQFVAGFVPPDYLIDGILQRRFIYSDTGHTGSGKTAVALRMAAHVALGLPLGKHPVQTGLVAYFAGENPDDVRMRWLALSAEMAFSVEAIGVHFIPGAFRISDLAERIRSETKAVGEFSLVVIDTSAAYFEGRDENANVEAAVHARRLRSLINLVSGGPTILVCCHPPKNASDGNLQPRGGGAFIAEMDGNLTCKKDGSIVELHWQGKFRGPDFAPVMFQLRTVTHGILKDSRGRHIPTVVAFPLSDEGQQELAAVERSNEDKLLIAIIGAPRASIAELAKLLGWLTRTGEPHKSLTWRLLQRLKQQRLVEEDRGEHIVTDKGKAAIARGGKIQNTANQGEAE